MAEQQMQQQLLNMANSTQQSQQMLEQMTALRLPSPLFKRSYPPTAKAAAAHEALAADEMTDKNATTTEDATAPVAPTSTAGPTETAPMAVLTARHQLMVTSKTQPMPTSRMVAPTVAIGSPRDDVGRY
jgi:hypothetical protein